ncbi:MAG: FimB/Mfa2 family fimbrial subunit, partial [Muribaculaceae bacterium]|nr:FimB/Mfa2 family fimbrial subunit [Muribaculaceae bacterium]
MSLKKHLINALVGTAIAAVPATALTSCDLIYTDLEPCTQGVELRFIYDYNMEFANAFPAQVDCLTLLVYDGAGKYLATHTVTDRSLLSDEDWRMQLRLDPGEYRFIAYGGMACENASFEFTSPSRAISALLSDLEVAMKPGLLGGQDGKPLHNLFYGQGTMTIAKTDTDYRRTTIYMIKDTNTLRVLLANADGTSLASDDFD